MVDVLTPEQRRLNMSRIKDKNSKIELRVRSELHQRGFRFRLHARSLPGTPDIVLPRHHTAIFVHGCFWHGHDCHLFKVPQTRREYWMQKIERNARRDSEAVARLVADGWKVVLIWECLLRGQEKGAIDACFDRAALAVVSQNEGCVDLSR